MIRAAFPLFEYAGIECGIGGLLSLAAPRCGERREGAERAAGIAAAEGSRGARLLTALLARFKLGVRLLICEQPIVGGRIFYGPL